METLQSLEKYEKSAIADVLETEYFDAGQNIVVEGQPGDKLYLLEEVTNPKPKTQNLFH
jgi:cAMP-dependent protein kinase regulator